MEISNAILDMLEEQFDERIVAIRLGVEAGLTTEQIVLYAKPEFCLEEMESAIIGLKGGLTAEQIQVFLKDQYDHMEMGLICEGFLSGISMNEMKSILSDEKGYYDILKDRINDILKGSYKENLEKARVIARRNKTYSLEALSDGARRLYQEFKEVYIESGHRYSGAISETSSNRKEIHELLECGLIQRRDCQAVSFELNVLERFSLIDEYDLPKKWKETGGSVFELNNGYFGELQRVLREVCFMPEYPHLMKCKDFDLFKEAFIEETLAKIEKTLELHNDADFYSKESEDYFEAADKWYSGYTTTSNFIRNYGDNPDYKLYDSVKHSFRGRNLEDIKRLVNEGADVNHAFMPKEFGYVPLHWAAHNGDIAVMEFLKDSGVNMNALTVDGRTTISRTMSARCLSLLTSSISL